MPNHPYDFTSQQKANELQLGRFPAVSFKSSSVSIYEPISCNQAGFPFLCIRAGGRFLDAD
jgi:hypothetical protein